MKSFIWLTGFLLLTTFSFSQNTFNALVKDSARDEPLAGVTVLAKNTGIIKTTNDKGIVSFTNLPSGENVFILSYTGAKEKQLSFVLPDSTLHLIYLTRQAATLNELIISTIDPNRIRTIVGTD